MPKMKKRNDPMFDGSVHISSPIHLLRSKVSDEDFQAALEEHWNETAEPQSAFDKAMEARLGKMLVHVLPPVKRWWEFWK